MYIILLIIHDQDIFNRLRTLRATTSKLAKEYATQANSATSALQAKELMEEGINKLELLYNDTVYSIVLVIYNSNQCM